MINKLNSNQLKLVAIITMTIDHIGYLLLPNFPILRFIGRLAFPIFAYQCSQGYLYTSNFTKYFFRLFLAAIFTQVLFFIFGIDYINVLFTLCLGLLCIYGLENKRVLLPIVCVLLTIAFNPDYNFYGVLMVVMFYYVKDIKKQCLIMILLNFALELYFYNGNFRVYAIIFSNLGLYYTSLSQYFAVFALPIIHMDSHTFIKYSSKKTKRLIQYGFYLYYPLHFILLTIISRSI